jgi:hypothetical protein
MDTYHHHLNGYMTPLTFLAAFALWSPGVAMLENGTSIEYLMEWSNWTTTLDTFLNESLRRCAAPSADRTCSVLNNNGCNRRRAQLWLYSTISTFKYFRPQSICSFRCDMLAALDHLPHLLVCAVLLRNADASTDEVTWFTDKTNSLYVNKQTVSHINRWFWYDPFNTILLYSHTQFIVSNLQFI